MVVSQWDGQRSRQILEKIKDWSKRLTIGSWSFWAQRQWRKKTEGIPNAHWCRVAKQLNEDKYVHVHRTGQTNTVIHQIVGKSIGLGWEVWEALPIGGKSVQNFPTVWPSMCGVSLNYPVLSRSSYLVAECCSWLWKSSGKVAKQSKPKAAQVVT